MKRIAVVAVRIAVEMDDERVKDLDAVSRVVATTLGGVVQGDNPVVSWQYDDWGLIPDELDWHLFEVENLDEVPQIRQRDVRIY